MAFAQLAASPRRKSFTSSPSRFARLKPIAGFAIVCIEVAVFAVNFTPLVWVLILLYGLVLLWYQSLDLNVNKDVVRLDAVTKTPIVNLVSEIVDGREVIAVFHSRRDPAAWQARV